jgi:hypothetical protein
LGDTFLRSFISVYDFENKRVGLAPHIYSNGSITEHIYRMKPWLIAVISISSVLVLIIIILVILKLRKNRTGKKLKDYDGANT